MAPVIGLQTADLNVSYKGEFRMITILKIDVVIKESKRFIATAMAAKERLKNDTSARYGCKETGAIRRASMDLSRALVSMRDNKL